MAFLEIPNAGVEMDGDYGLVTRNCAFYQHARLAMGKGIGKTVYNEHIYKFATTA